MGISPKVPLDGPYWPSGGPVWWFLRLIALGVGLTVTFALGFHNGTQQPRKPPDLRAILRADVPDDEDVIAVAPANSKDCYRLHGLAAATPQEK